MEVRQQFTEPQLFAASIFGSRFTETRARATLPVKCAALQYHGATSARVFLSSGPPALSTYFGTCPPVRVIWISVPRTGTRHLYDILKTEYGETRRIDNTVCAGNWTELHRRPTDWAQIQRLPRETRGIESACASIEAVGARSWLAEMSAATSAGVRLITMVRQPLAWALSYFSLGSNRSASVYARQRDFAEFVASPFATNFQLAFLAGKRLPLLRHRSALADPRSDAAALLQRERDAAGSRMSVTSTPCFVRPPRAPSSAAAESDLRRVRSWIEAGALIAGTTETFEATVRSYASTLGWRRFAVDAEKSFGPRYNAANAAQAKKGASRVGDLTVDPLTEADLLAVDPAWAKRLAAQLDASLDARLHALAQKSAEHGAAGL